MCEASQNGLFREWPHRQRATAEPSGSSNGRPSASTIVIGPGDLVRPVRPHGDRDVAHGPTLSGRASRLQSDSRVASHLPRDAPRVVGAARHERARRRPRRGAPGHAVTRVVVLAPSSRSADLLAGRRTLQTGVLDGVVAVSRAVPVSPRSAVGIPVGVRANVATALRRGDFDVVHGFDPGVPGLAYVALLEAQTTTAATFVDPERLAFPPRRNAARPSARRASTRLVATSDEVAERIGQASTLSGVLHGLPAGSQASSGSRRRRSPPGGRGDRDVGGGPAHRPLDAARAPSASTAGRPSCCAPRRLAVRPSIPLGLSRPRARPHRGSAVGGACRVLREAAIVVPSPDGLRRTARPRPTAAELRDRGAAGRRRAAGAGRGGPIAVRRGRGGAAARRRLPSGQSVSDEGLQTPSRGAWSVLYIEAQGRRRAPRRHETEPLADRDWIVADLHMHTNWSHDCSIEPADASSHTRRPRGSAPSR